jgi:hypothetical protein
MVVFTIHLDNMIIGAAVCSKILHTKIEPGEVIMNNTDTTSAPTLSSTFLLKKDINLIFLDEATTFFGTDKQF